MQNDAFLAISMLYVFYTTAAERMVENLFLKSSFLQRFAFHISFGTTFRGGIRAITKRVPKKKKDFGAAAFRGEHHLLIVYAHF